MSCINSMECRIGECQSCYKHLSSPFRSVLRIHFIYSIECNSIFSENLSLSTPRLAQSIDRSLVTKPIFNGSGFESVIGLSYFYYLFFLFLILFQILFSFMYFYLFFLFISFSFFFLCYDVMLINVHNNIFYHCGVGIWCYSGYCYLPQIAVRAYMLYIQYVHDLNITHELAFEFVSTFR